MVSFAIGALVALVLATAADAQDQRCRFKLNGGFIRWGLQDQQGWFAVPAGSPCHVPVHVGGFSTLSSAQIVERPHHGTAVTSNDGMIHFRPNSGFTGNDSMTVRYGGTGLQGAGQQATIIWTIMVF
jgi:Bacterial Ig domain